ncbi:hypothetical protein [Spartinivicinus poritis]|uniref:Solute-binding protein family 3/N-terminal domain-containing protein n=1 Tax=Spartinivicinus poritis TaxID=2994640 RepID=A0ABT5UE82_9GAMM|nr:hypothetical protein [Spartinivicinus sp. A2-2]MDE1464689.1 hypothetical protein [Spartinivicinus sp. A2-2]
MTFFSTNRHHIISQHFLLVVILLFTPYSAYSNAKEINLTIYGGRNSAYFHELLISSLQHAGHQVSITKLSEQYNQKRLMAMLAQNEVISLMWRGQNPKYDGLFQYVDAPLTLGLKGYRIFFIRQGTQHKFNDIQTLEDFRHSKLVGGFGFGWSDTKIWHHNGLPFKEKDGSIDPDLYLMLHSGKRGIDYFSRAAFEIGPEHKKHNYLDIEKKLVFIYPRDFRFYLAKSFEHLKPTLEQAIKDYSEQGHVKRLIMKHFPEIYDPNGLNLDNRIKIYLSMPW